MIASMMLEKSDWPYKAHKAGNGWEPCKPLIVYKKPTIIGLIRPKISLTGLLQGLKSRYKANNDPKHH